MLAIIGLASLMVKYSFASKVMSHVRCGIHRM